MIKKTLIAVSSLALSLPITCHAQIKEEPQKQKAVINFQELKHPVKPMLWKITKDTLAEPSYLFGTIHLNDERVTTLHPAAELAFSMSDVFYAEIDFSVEAQLKAAQLYIREDDQTFSKSIGPELTNIIEQELALINEQMTLEPLDSIKTWCLAFSLSLIEEQLEGKPFLDYLLWLRADQDEKKLDTLEKPKELLGQMDKLTEEEQISLLRSALNDMKTARAKGEHTYHRYIQAYLLGDDEKILQLFKINDLSVITPELKEKFTNLLIYQRNQKMAEKIDTSLISEPNKVHFFAAGALHYIGDKSVNDLLTEKGYTITRVDPAEK